MKFLVVFVFSLFYVSRSYAGLFEFGVSGTYRFSEIDENNFTKSNSLTGSVSYYFMEMSALELSYTSGVSHQSVFQSGVQTKYIYEYQHYGADLVFSFADRKSSLQPYLKGGVATIEKKLFAEVGNLPRELLREEEPTQVPSVGVGFKLMLTQAISFKAGFDAWGDSDKKFNKWDNAARAGISIFF